MKKKSLIMPAVLVMFCILSGSAFALDHPEGPPPAQGLCRPASFPLQPPMPPGMMYLLNSVENNVLSELTGQSQENIRMMRVSAPVPAILDQYDVDPKVFRTAMDKQIAKLVNQAAANGSINKKQAEEILKKMARKPVRPSEE